MYARVGGMVVLAAVAAGAGAMEGEALQTVALLLAGGAAWGDLKATVRDLSRRVAHLEKKHEGD